MNSLTYDEIEELLISRHSYKVHQKVKNAKVAICGIGGLGSNIAVSLARLGIGNLLLIDFDIVDKSNLNRQHYFIKHLGMKKTNALKEIISEINPYIKIDTLNAFLDENNISDILKDYEIVVEAFDNPSSKATLVNEVLKLKSKKLVCASGISGYFDSNLIKTNKINDSFYLIGDGINGIDSNLSLMSPRVLIAAGHQANKVLQIIIES